MSFHTIGKWGSFITLILLSKMVGAQVFIEEDFSSGSLPIGWANNRISGVAGDEWKYNNPGSRALTKPIQASFAVFDAANYSTGNGGEEVALESVGFDGSNKSQIILEFNHHFSAGTGAKGFIEVFDGVNWQTVDSTAGNNTEKRTINITTHAAHANAKVRFRWTGNGAGFWVVDNVVVAAPVHQFSHFQGFDTWTNGVDNAQDGWVDEVLDDFDWTVNSGSTPSSSTGPTSDQTGSGKYLFTEATGGSTNDSAVMLSPYFNLDAIDTSITPVLTWFYNMNGSNMGTLKLYIQQDLSWNLAFTQSGNKGNVWTADTQQLDTLNGLVRFRFVGVRGNGFRSDMAIDQVNLIALSGKDVGVTEILGPITSCAHSSAEKVKVVVKNFGTVAVSNVPLTYRLNGTLLNTPETLAKNINPGDTAHFTFTAKADVSGFQHHDLVGITAMPFDDKASNDSTVSRFTNYASVSTFPFKTDFDNWPLGAGKEADNWVQIENTIDKRDWVVDSGPGFKSPNTGPGIGDVEGTGKYLTIQTVGMNNGDSAVIETPCFDLSALNSTKPVLQFYRHMFGTSIGNLRIRVITGNTSTKIFDKSGSSGDVWIKEEVDLSAFANTTIRLRFVGHRGGSLNSDIAIDNVEIKQSTGFDLSTQQVSGITTGCGLTSNETLEVVLKNEGDSTISAAGVSLFLNGNLEVRDTLTRQILTGDTIHHTFSKILNLSDTGNYAFFVRNHLTPDDDEDNDTTNLFVRNRRILTNADIPYLENFDALSEGSRVEIGNDWTSGTDGNVLNWTVEFGNTPSGSTGPTADFGGNGHYVYMDRDLNTSADSAVLISPCLDFTGIVGGKALVLQFYRNMNGSNITDLHVDVNNGHRWVRMQTFSGNQGNVWRKADIKLDTFTQIKLVRFVCEKPNGSRGDVAIDDIRFLRFNGFDVQAVAVTAPQDSCGMGFETATAIIKNIGDSAVSNFQVQLLKNDVLVATDTVTQNLNSGDSVIFSFTQKVNMNPDGIHKISIKTLLPNEDDTDNDTTSRFVKNGLLISQFPYVQNFDSWTNGTGNVDDGWVSKTVSGSEWIVDDFAGGFNNTGPSDDITGGGKYIYFFAGGSGGNSDSVVVHTPCIDTRALQNPQLRFFSHMFGTSVGELNVDVLHNGSFTRLFSKTGNHGDTYFQETVDLKNFKGIIELRFVAKEFINGTSGEIAIDQVSVIDATGFDLNVIAIEGPVSDCGLGNETVKVKVSNAGDSNMTSIPLAYKFNGGATVNQTFAQTLNVGDTVSLSFSQQVNFNAAGTFALQVFHNSLKDDNRIDDTLNAQVVNNVVIDQFGHFEDFDTWPTGLNDDEGWSQLTTDDFDWTVQSGKTGSNNTGPPSDRDGTGRYLYIEASNPRSTGDEALILSPCIDFTGVTANIKVEFSYHMFGANTGTLDVFLVDSTGNHSLFTESGDQGNQWNDTSVVLDSLGKGQVVKLLFRAIRGNGFASDIAIDDVNIKVEGAPDLAVIELVEPTTSLTFSSSETVKVKLKNLKPIRIENIDVSLKVNGQSVVTDQLDSISAGDSLIHTFSTGANLSADGEYEIEVVAKGDNDGDATNDTLKTQVVNQVVVAQLPYRETFDALADGFGFRNGWFSEGGDFEWRVQTEPNALNTDKPFSDGNNGTKYQLARIRFQNQGDSAMLFSPHFDFSTLGQQNDFLVKFAVSSTDDDFGTLRLHMLRNGKPDSLLFEKSNRSVSGSFEGVSLLLDSLTDTVQFRFTVKKGSTTNTFQWAAIDDFRIDQLGRQDISVRDIFEPFNFVLGNAEQVKIRYANMGQFDIASGTKLPFAYRVEGGSIFRDTFTLTADLPADSSTQDFTFSQTFDFSIPGTYDVEAWSELDADGLAANDTFKRGVVSLKTISTFPFKEDFENGDGTFIGTNEFELGIPAGDYIDDAASGTKAFVTGLEGDIENGTSVLLSPMFDFTGLTVDPILKFAYKSNMVSTVNRVTLKSSENGTATSQNIAINYTAINWHNNTNINHSWTDNNPSDSNGWDTASIELIGFKGKKFRFIFTYDKQTGTEEGFGVDDFQVILPPANDVAVKEVFTPIGHCGLGNETFEIDIRNFGNNNIVNCPVFYQVNGGAAVQDTVTDTLKPGDILRFAFSQKINMSAAGTYQVKAFTGLAADVNKENDTLSSDEIFKPISISNFPYTENFETNDGGWRAEGLDAVPIWEHGTPTGTHIDAAGSGQKAWVTILSGDLKDSDTAFLLSPCFDFTNLPTDPEISFLHNYDIRTLAEHRLQVSLNGGLTWADVGTATSDGTNWYNDQGDNAWNGTNPSGAGNWDLAKHRLDGTAGKNNVRLRFTMSKTFSFNGFEGAGVDSIRIALPTEPDVKLLSVEEIFCGFNSTNTIKARLTNIGGTNEPNLQVKYAINGVAISSFETISDTLKPGDTITYAFTTKADLSAGGNIEVKVFHALNNDSKKDNDTAAVIMESAPIVSTPHFQLFNRFPKGTNLAEHWLQETEEDNFTVEADTSGFYTTPPGGAIGNPDTGPRTDFTGNGKLLYMDAEDGGNSREAIVYSPCFDISQLSDAKLKFKLHMYVDAHNNLNEGSISVEALVNNQWNQLVKFDENSALPDGTFDFDNDQWDQVEIGIDSLPDTTRFRFIFKSRKSGLKFVNFVNQIVRNVNIGLDNVEVTGEVPFDVGVIAIDSPITSCGLGFENVAIKVVNFGSQSLAQNTIIPCNFQVDGGPVATNNLLLPSTLNPGDTVSLTFASKGDFRVLKTYSISAWTSLAADSINQQNDTFGVVQFTSIGARSVFPYVTDFENDLNDWTIEGVSNDWERGTLDGAEYLQPAFNGTKALVTNLDGNVTNQTSTITSPCMDFSTFARDPRIRFDLSHELAAANIGFLNQMQFKLEISSDAGQTFTTLAPSVQSKNFYNDKTNNRFTGNHSTSLDWIECMNVLTGMAGEQSVQVKFVFRQNTNTQVEGIGLDNIIIEESPAIDVEVVSILKPDTGFAKTQDSVAIQCINRGVSTISSGTALAISYQKNGGTVVTENITTPSNWSAGDTLVFNFNTLLNVAADTLYQVKAWAKLTGDGIATNDTLEREAINQQIETKFPITYKWTESKRGWFSHGTFNSFEFGKPKTGHQAPGLLDSSMWVTNISGEYNNHEKSFLESPVYDFSRIANDPEVGFLLSFKTAINSGVKDHLHLEVSTNAGKSWNKVLAGDSAQNWYNNASDKVWDGTSAGLFGNWLIAENNLPGLKGEKRVKFRFVFESNKAGVSDGIGVDFFTVNAEIKSDLELVNLVNPIPNANLHLDSGLVFKVRNAFTDTVFLEFEPLNLRADVTFPNGSKDSFKLAVFDSVFAPGDTLCFNLSDTFKIQDTGTYTFACTINLASDTNDLNDSLFFTIKQKKQITPLGAVGTPVRDTASRAETNDEWTYYYDNGPDGTANTDDDILVLGLKLNGNKIGRIGDGTFEVLVAATGGDAQGYGHTIDTNETGNGSYPSNPNGWTVMPRYWDVNPTRQPDSAVGVRFFYTDADFRFLNKSLKDSLNGDTMDAHTEMVMCKIRNHNPDPLTGHSGVRSTDVTVLTHGPNPTVNTWVHGTINGLNYAEFEVTSFSGGLFGVGGDGGSPLPVDLTYFTAQWLEEGEVAQLTWQTAMEENNSHFELQRSFDGVEWETRFTIEGQGTKLAPTDYSVQDIISFSDEHDRVYYRLKQVDFDGMFTQSAVRHLVLNQSSTSAEMEIYPNPTVDKFYVQPSGFGGTIYYHIYDLRGQRIKAGTLSNQVIDVEDLPGGQYILEVADGQSMLTKKVSVVR